MATQKVGVHYHPKIIQLIPKLLLLSLARRLQTHHVKCDRCSWLLKVNVSDHL